MSMEDIIKLLKVQKEEQKSDIQEMFKQQREEEKKEREKEKEALLNNIRDGIREEIKTEMKPLEVKTDNIEKVALGIGNEVKDLAKKVMTLEEELARLKQKQDGSSSKEKSYRDAARDSGPSTLHEKEKERVEEETTIKDKKEDHVKKLISKAATIIGLKPIDKVHVQHIMRRQKEEMTTESEEEQWQEAMHTAAKMFLEKEMRIGREEFNSLEIVKIFPPAKDDWNVLYVEFRTRKQASLVYTYTQYMRKNVQGDGKPEVQLYVPKELYSRFRALNLAAFKIREASMKTISTRVTLGERDFILQQRHKSDKGKGWGDPLPLPDDLPDIEMNLHRGPLSPGEAPGRTPFTPEQEDSRKRKDRSSSTTPVFSSSPPNKRPQMTLEAEIEAAELVSDCSVTTPPVGQGLLSAPEVGCVISVQGQNTPGRKKISESGEIESPIISSRRLALQK